jgi:glycogen(starch) synthase
VKILHVLDHSLPHASGYVYRTESILRFQKALGLEPLVLTSSKQGDVRAECEELEGRKYFRTRPVRMRAPAVRELELMARLAARIIRLGRREGVRLIHAHSPLLNGLPALLASRRLGVPLLYEARAFWEDAAVDHGTYREGSLRYRVTRSLETMVFRHADASVTICEGMRQELLTRGIQASQVVVVPNGVDTGWFAPRTHSTVRTRLGLGDGPVIGFVGSFYHYEGLGLLLEAAPEILAGIPDARILLVGAGREEGVLRRQASGLGDRVVMTGRVPHEHIRDYYSAIDLFVCPRRRMRLTELVTPLKPLEAMAMGLAVLASDVGGHSELIRHGDTGLLFKADSVEALIREVRAVCADAARRRGLGARARDYVMRERTWERIASTYPPLYERLISNASR